MSETVEIPEHNYEVDDYFKYEHDDSSVFTVQEIVYEVSRDELFYRSQSLSDVDNNEMIKVDTVDRTSYRILPPKCPDCESRGEMYIDTDWICENSSCSVNEYDKQPVKAGDEL
jgi:hypothetical protein